MALVFSAIVPHPPQLTPDAKETVTEDTKKTRAAFQVLEEQLYAAKPDLLVVISPHGEVLRNSWQLLIGDTLTGTLEEFGNMATTISVKGSVGFSHRVKERAEDHRFPVLLQSSRPLDYACTIPLLSLLPHLPGLRVSPLIVSGEDVSSHFEFGKMLREEIFATNERVAVIASANLSHRLTKTSPMGYHRSGKIFDDRIRSALEAGKPDELFTLSDEIIEDAVSCGLRPIAVLMGILYRRSFHVEALAYEHPHGVGYYTAALHSS